MNFLWKILRYPYWLWAALIMLLFLVTSVIYSFLVLIVMRRRSVPYLLFFYKMWANLFCIGCGIRIRHHNRHHLMQSAPCIAVSNHCSNIDMFLGAIALPLNCKPLGKIELKKIPLLGYLFSVAAVLVDRKSKESREKSMLRLRQELIRGNTIFLYPEGTRNKTNKPLLPFYDGAFRFAIESGKPLVAFVSVNTKNVVPASGAQVKPGWIDLHYLPPYETTNLTSKDVDDLKKQVYADMEAVLLKHDPDFK